jgi:aspartate/methionine/tyrosine aminotransferase
MRYSSLTSRLHSDGMDGWATLFEAWRAKERGEDVIILSVGDPDFATPEPIVERAVDALRDGDTHYTVIEGRLELRAAVAADMEARTGLELDATNVIITAGTQNALLAASLCLLESGDEVIGLDPMYLTYEGTLRAGGAELVRVAQTAASGFRPDAEAIGAAVTEKTRVIVLTSPNNPTGVVFTRQELEDIGAIAQDHDLWVIADEVYSDLLFGGDHLSIASLPGMAGRTVTVSSLSKSHAMTGWRIGWAVAPPELIEHLNALQVNINYGVPGFVQQAALEAVTEQRQAWRTMRDAYQRRRDLAASILSAVPDLKVLVPQAGMYLLVDVRGVAASSRTFTHDLFAAKRVSVVDAGAFGQPSDGWIRISFTIDDELLAEGCKRIVDFVRSLGVGASPI